MTTVYTVMDDGYAEPVTLYICSTREHAERCLEETVRRFVEKYPGMQYACREHFHIDEEELDSYLNERRREYWAADVGIETGDVSVGRRGVEYADTSECGFAAADEDGWCYGKSYVSQEHATELAVECRRAELAKRGTG